MPKTIEIIEPYFSHDINARSDEKIVKMFFEFRKNKNTYSESTVRELLSFASYGVYWSVVEYMHRNNLDVADVDMLADELRIDSDFLKSILDDFDLFRKENGEYINDRIIRNINKQEEKSKKNKEAISVRWLISAYNKAYKEEYGITPVLDDKEKKNLIDYSNKIENFKDLLPDILYTMRFIKFDNDSNFKPASNWLLKENNLAQILNGQWGKLKHKKTKKELEAEQKQLEAERQKNEEPCELEIQANSICNKVDALELIIKNTKIIQGKPFVIPSLHKLRDRFEITPQEIKEYMSKE